MAVLVLMAKPVTETPLAVGPPDPVHVIEACYDLAPSDANWLAGVVRAARPLLDKGLGVAGWSYEIRYDKPRSNTIDLPIYIGCRDGLHECFRDMMPLGKWTEVAHAHRGSTCASFSDRMRALPGWTKQAYPLHPVVRHLHQRAGMRDFLQIFAREEASPGVERGFVLIAPREQVASFPSRSAGLFVRLSRHLVAGCKLRRALRRGSTEALAHVPVDIEASLDASARTVHAEGEAKEPAARRLLEAAARDLVLSRGTLRREEPARAVELWRGMVDGRWTLIDGWDSAGKRVILARRAVPDDPHHPLSGVERHVLGLAGLGCSNKLIAYEVGISATRVSELLHSGLRKLGLRSLVELLRLQAPRAAD